MPWNEVRADLLAKGKTIADIARRHRKTVTNLCKVKSKSHPPAQAILAQEMGRNPQDVWPSRYHPSGAPIRHAIWSKSTAGRRVGHRQKSGRA
jgi:lambda repressor-like predicted transcriptional regulator